MLIAVIPLALWLILYLLGKYVALRDVLTHADAIVCLAGTRSNLQTLHDKIDTAISLYNKGKAPLIIMTGMFSGKINETYTSVSQSQLEKYAKVGRIKADHIKFALEHWDTDLGADYMKWYAIKKGIPEKAILTENLSLHTNESAQFTAEILKKHHVLSIILVSAPFHQRRTYEAFKKYLPSNIHIYNYAADSKDWNEYFWFLSRNNCTLVWSEIKRIFQYRRQK